MELQEIYDLIIALVPSASAILTCIITVISVVFKLKNVKKSFDDKTDLKLFKQDLKAIRKMCTDLTEELAKKNAEVEHWKTLAINRTTEKEV